MMLRLKRSTLMSCSIWNSCTATTHTRHWKKSSALTDLKEKEERAILFRRTCGGGGPASQQAPVAGGVARRRCRPQAARTLMDLAALQALGPPAARALVRHEAPIPAPPHHTQAGAAVEGACEQRGGQTQDAAAVMLLVHGEHLQQQQQQRQLLSHPPARPKALLPALTTTLAALSTSLPSSAWASSFSMSSLLRLEWGERSLVLGSFIRGATNSGASIHRGGRLLKTIEVADAET